MELFFSPLPEGGRTAGIFLDRDGVINERIWGGYVTQWHEFRFVPGILNTLRDLARYPIPLIVVSNQAGVGKGLVQESALEALTRQFVARIQDCGGRIDAVYYCTHTPESRCGCRKPQPGLLRRAASDWFVDLSASVLIGDSSSDVEAAAAADCHAILVDPSTPSLSVPSTLHARTVEEIARYVRCCLQMRPALRPTLSSDC